VAIAAIWSWLVVSAVMILLSRGRSSAGRGPKAASSSSIQGPGLFGADRLIGPVAMTCSSPPGPLTSASVCSTPFPRPVIRRASG